MPRAFDRDRDLEHLQRIWRETGWLKDGEKFERGLDAYLKACNTIVEDLHGEMEVGASRAEGVLRVQQTSVPLCVIAGVYAGIAGRQGGHATRLTALQVAAGVADGAVVASLGIFDQGFYERLGFGIGPYVHRITVEPSSLKVPRLERSPVRLTVDDAAEIHACRLARRHSHGCVDLSHAGVTELGCCEHAGAGLGFRDTDGVLTHCMWVSQDGKAEDGPWSVQWMAWRTPAQLFELLGIVKSFADQVSGVRIADPAGLQLQDLIDRPFAWLRRTKGGPNYGKPTSIAYWQHRICDVQACMAALSLPRADAKFNLRLRDPIEGHLPGDAPWKGCAGDWIVSLGERCGAEAGRDEALPTLEASINAFTRMWIGVRSAQSLAITDDLSGSDALLDTLSAQWTLPEPATDWDY